MRILYTFLVYLISIGYSSVYAAKSYTWTGATNGNWQTTSNWSPNTGFPVDGDDVTISAGTNVPKLDQARTFKNFTISGNKSLDLNGFTMSISGAATFTSGSIISTTGIGAISVNGNSNSTFGSAGTTMSFGSSTNNVNVQSICPRIFVNGPITVNGNLEFEKTKTTADSWASGITVNGNTKITCSQNGGSSGILIGTTTGTNLFNGNLELNNSSASQIILGGISGSTTTINGKVKLINTNTGSIDFAYSTAGNTTPNNATININGNIEFNNTSTGSIGFGRNSTVSTPAITLALNKGIAVGTDGGFTNGTIIFRSFTYSGTSPFNFTTTGGSVNFLDNSTFNCPITISAANIALNGTTFNGVVDFTKTNNTAYSCTGFNTYNQSVSLTNTGTANWIFGTTNPDIFNKPVTFRNTNTGAIYIGYNSVGNQFNDNIILDETGTGSIRFGNTTNNPITFADGKTITTANSTSPGLLVFNKITFPSNTPLNLDLGCTASLNFISCTLNSSVNVKSGSYEFQSNNFNAPVTVEKCGNVTGSNDLVYGGNTFSTNAPVHFINSSLIHLVLCQSAPDIYNSDFTLTSSNNNYIYASNFANGTQYNGNIILNKTAGNYGFDFGNGANAFSTLADGKTITLNASSGLSTNWYLSIRKITQNGNTVPSQNPINIASGNYCIITLTQNEFNAAVNVTNAGAILLASNTFWQPCYFELTGAIAGTGNGGNNYKNTVIFKHSGTANWIHANTTKDVFENDVTLNSTNTGNIYLAHNSLGNEFKGDIIINKNSGTGAMFFGNGANASSTLADGKTIKIGSEFSIGGLNISRLSQQGITPISLSRTGTSTITFGAGNTFNGNITLTGTSTGATSFTSDTLNGGLTINTPGNASFTGNTINGNIDILNSGTSIVTFGANNTVNGALSAIAPSVLFNGTGSIYNGIVNVTINGNATTYYWQGTQIFNNDVIVNHNTSSANLYITLAATHTFKFFGNVTFNKNAAGILVSCYGVCEFYKDVTYNYTGGLGYWPYHFGYNGGVTKFLGSNTQNVSSNNPNGLECFSILVDKPQNHVTLTTKINMVSSPYPVVAAPVLTLNSGNLICKGSSFVSLRNTGANGEVTSGTSWVVGGSANSFVDGPFIKVGTGAFTFPIGKGTLAGSPIYAPIAISAPATSSTFQAEAFIATPSNNTSTDATIKNISSCQYWNVQRIGGTSNVQVTLPWDATTCTLINPSNVKVARYNGTTWTNAGANNLINTPPTGSITSNTTNNSFGLYTFGIDVPLTVTATKKDPCFGQNNGTITLTVSGGKYPYSYSWNNGATTQNLAAIPEGTYNVTVTDASGATQTASVTLNAATEIKVVLNRNGHDVQTSVSGGVAPYTYLWSNNSTNASQTALANGTYTLTVTDANGCTNSQLAVVTIMDPLTQKAVKISAGSFQSAKLCDDGSLYVWGASFAGNKTTPYKVPDFSGVVNICDNSSNTFVLKNDGSVWAVGQNSFGQLGNGNTQNSSTFNPVLNLTNIVDIKCGEHSVVLRSDGTVWEWGHIHSYDFNIATTPVKVQGLENVISIAGDGGTFFALKLDGSVWAWGYNYWGNVGDGTTQDRDVPVQILSNIVSVSSSGGHTLALNTDGTVLGWGYNAYGEVGSGTSGGKVLTPSQVQGLAGVAKIIAGQGNSFVIKNDGSVWAWGKNDSGQFGNGTTANSLTPIQIPGLTNVNDISIGSLHSLFLKNDGVLLASGSNGYGQLGDGSPTVTSGKGGGLPAYKTTPTSVYVPGGCFVPDCSGLTVNAGNDQTLVYGRSLTLTASVTGATSVSWNNGITNAVAFNPPIGSTTYIVTASNNNGCLVTDTVIVKVELPQTKVKLAACDHSVKVCDDGSVYTWGSNIYGALGDGTTTSRNLPGIVPNLQNVVAVSAGVTNTLALKNDGTVWAWGLNLHGNLGNGTMTDANSPVQVSDISGIVSMDTKFHHVLALKNDGTVWAWGYNVYGELGQTGMTTSTRPLMVPGLNGIIAIETGSYHSVALKADGTVWAWGRNGSGELGDGTTVDRYTPMPVNGLVNVKQISALTQATYALTQDGHLYAWGANSGLIGDGTTSTYFNPVNVLSNVVEILSGGSQTIIVRKNDGTVWGWGTNTTGQLNDGSTTNRSTPVLLSNFYSDDLVCLGSSHVLIQNNDGTLFSEGYNANGQLGDGTNTNQYTPVSIYVPGGCFIKPACAVSNTNDSGPGSLRAAIECANSMDSHSQIIFRIPGVGPYTIHCQSPLPNLINTHGITIDGKAQSLSEKGTGDQTIILDNARINIIEGSNTLSNISFVNGQGMYIQSSVNTLDHLLGDHISPIVVEGGGNNTIKDCSILNPNSPVIVLSNGTGGNEIYNTTLRGEQSPTLIVYSSGNSINKDTIFNNKAHALIITDNSSNNTIDSVLIKRETFLGATDTTTYSYYAAGILMDGTDVKNNLASNTNIHGFNFGVQLGANAHHNTFKRGNIHALDYGLFINGSNNTFDTTSFNALYANRSRIGVFIVNGANSNIISNSNIIGFTANAIFIGAPSRNNTILNNKIRGTMATLYPASENISKVGPYSANILFSSGGILNNAGYNIFENNFIENYYTAIRLSLDSAIVRGNIIGRTGVAGIQISNWDNYNTIIENNKIGFNEDLSNSLITGVGIGFYGANGTKVRNNIIGNIQRYSTSDPLNGNYVARVPNVDGSAIAGLYGGGQNILITDNKIGINEFGIAAPIQNIGIHFNNSAAGHTAGQMVWNSTVSNNIIKNFSITGIELGTSFGNTISNNDINGGLYGLKVLSSSNNKIFNNNFNYHTNGSIFMNRQGGAFISGYDFYLTHQNFISRNSYQNNGAQKNINLNYGDLSQVANEGKQAPVLLNLLGGASLTINGTALAGDTIEIYEVIGSGTSKTYTYITSIATTSNNWTANFPITLLQNGIGSTITATATDANANTSEFGNEITGCSTCCYVTTTADSGPGSLREAINCANSSSDPSTIRFNIPEDGDHTIRITSAVLPDLLYSTIIDGSTQPSGKIVIADYGYPAFSFKNSIPNQTSTVNAITFVNTYAIATSNQQTLRLNNCVSDHAQNGIEGDFNADSLIITNTTFTNGYTFIYLYNKTTKYVKIQNSTFDNFDYLVLRSELTSADFIFENNSFTRGHQSGDAPISITQAKSLVISGNHIAGNNSHGINLYNIQGKTVIKGNTIGLSLDKKSVMPNALSGVNISKCIVYIDSNFIGGNNQYGIYSESNTVYISRNYIGTNSTWDNLGNIGEGIHLGRNDIAIIGGSTLDSANFIGFNRGNGVYINSLSTIIKNNYVGVSPSFANIGNSGSGFYCDGDSKKFIGNYIGFNKGSGISNWASWEDIYYNNFIGGDLIHNFANERWGIESFGYGIVKNNIISNNTLGGILNEDEQLKISQNTFAGNQPIAISLNNGAGNNNKQPGIFTTCSFAAMTITLKGTGNDGDTIEVFHNDGVSETALIYAGYAVVSGGKWSLTIPQGPAYDPLNDNYYVNTATDADGNTSQLSALYKVGFCIVINTDDSGPGSLREAINCANSLPYAGRIKFAIPGDGPYNINTMNEGPLVITNPYGVTFDGFTQLLSGQGTGSNQRVNLTSNLILADVAGPSSIQNLSFLGSSSVYCMADSVQINSNSFNGTLVRVQLTQSSSLQNIEVSKNAFVNSASFNGNYINGLSFKHNSFDYISGGLAIFLNGSKNIAIDSNYFEGNSAGMIGMNLTGCSFGFISNNSFKNIGTAISYSNLNDFSIDSNYIHNYGTGITIGITGGARLKIRNNTILNGSDKAIYCDLSDSEISNNYIDTCTFGIDVVNNQGGIINSVVSNNQIYHFTTYGIEFGQGHESSIINNIIGNGTGSGINITREHDNIVIRNNRIGLNLTNQQIPIIGYGMYLTRTGGQSIGGVLENNTIGNIKYSSILENDINKGTGSAIYFRMAASSLQIQNNLFGVDESGNQHSLDYAGILLYNTTYGPNITIKNNIFANSPKGVEFLATRSFTLEKNIFVNTTTAVNVKSNEAGTSIYNKIIGNTYIGGATPVININIGTTEEGNNGKAQPFINSFKVSGNDIVIAGVSEKGNTIELYQATGTTQVTYSYLMTVTADQSTGFWIASLPLANLKDQNLRSVLYATATDTDNNTSQFSTGYPICPICECIVTNINDSGDGSFREAINCTNSLGNGAKIKFNIPSASIDTIKITTAMLPSFLYNVEVDGSSQPGFVAGQSPKIFIKNESGVSRGLVFTQANSSIRGIGMKNFAPSLIFTSDADNSLVEYCTVINDGFSIALSGDGDNIQIMGCHFGITHNGDGQGSGNAPGLVINNAIIGSKDKPNVITNYFYAGIWGNNTVLYNTIYGNGDPSTKKAIYSPDRIPSGHSAVYENFVWKIKGVAPAKSRIQLFLNNGIQQQALAYVDELFADANGNWTYIVPNQYLPVTKNSYFVYTYTEATSGLTSELSSVITVGNFATQCFVTNTNNDGTGSLRYAINNCANPAPNHAEIIFQLPDNGARINGSLIPVSRTIDVNAPSFQFTNPNGITMDGTTAWVKLVARDNITTMLTANSNSNIISRITFDGSSTSGAVDLGGNYSVLTNCEITNVGFRSGSIYGNNHVIANNYIHGINVENHQGLWLQGNNLNFANNFIGIKPDGTDSKVKVSSFGSVVAVGDKVTVKNNIIGNIDTAAVDNTSKAAIFVYNSSFGKVNILNNTIGKYNGRAIPVPTIGIALTGCDNTDCPTNDLISGNTITNCRYGISARGNGDTISNNTFIDISEVSIQNFGKMTLDPVTNPDHVSYLTRNLIFNTPASKKAILSDIANPVITRFYHGTWDWLIEGTSIPNATIELFLNDGLGENAIKYLNTIKANESGYWKLSVPDDVIDVEQEYLYVTATATTTDYATSGLSNIGVLHILKCTVESTENSGPKTLRECITQANEGTVNYIKFNITTGELPVEINITEVLPTITTLAKGLIINGATQPGTLPSGQYNKIVVKNDDEVNYGFTIGDVTGVALRNISVKDFATGLYYTGTANKTKAVHMEITGHTASGVLVDATCGDSVRVTNSRIEGNRLAEYGIYNHAAGAYFDTLLVDGHTKSGIYIEGASTKLVSDVVIAGDTLTNNYPEDKQTKSDYTGGIVGMYMKDSKVSGNIAYDNNYALFLGFASNNDISENGSYKAVNSISESTQKDTIINVGNGVDALHTLSSSGNTISANEFNYCMNGISLNSSNNNEITAGTVSYNTQRGIEVAASTGVKIESVTLYSNEFDGIYVSANSDGTVIKKCHVGSSDKNFQVGFGNEFYGVNLLSSNNSVTDNIIGFNKKGAVNVGNTTSSNKVVRNYLFPNPSKPTALSININYIGNTGITPPRITKQSSSGAFITLSGDGVDDGDSIHIYRNRGYIQEANKLLAAVKAEGNSWTATIDTTLLFDTYSAYVVATTTDQDNNTSQLSDMYSLGYCMVNTQDDNGRNDYPTNASLRMAVNCVNSSQVKARLMVNIEGVKNPVINLKGSVLPAIFNDHGVDMNGRNRFFGFIKETKLQVQRDASVSETLGGEYIFELTNNVDKASIKNFIIKNGRGIKAESDTLQMETTIFKNPYSSLYDASYSPSTVPVAATSQGLWTSRNNLVVLHKVSIDSFSNGVGAYQVDQLRIDSSSFTNSVAGLFSSASSDLIWLSANNFDGNNSTGAFFGPLNNAEIVVNSNAFSGKGIGMTLLGAKHANISGNTFNTIVPNSASTILDSDNNNAIGIYLIDSTGTVQILNNTFNNVRGAAISFDKDAKIGGSSYVGTAYPDSVLIYQNKVLGDTIAFNIKGRSHSIHHNNLMGSILVKESKRSHIYLNTISGRNGFVNMASSDSVVVSKNAITGFIGRNDSKSIHLNKGTANVSNGGKNAPRFNQSSLVANAGRIRVAITGKAHPFDDVELFKSDTLNPYLISYVNTISANASGDWTYIVPTEEVPIKKGDFYIATATSPDTLRTSEASSIYYLPVQKYDIIVRNTNDAGANSLRNALNLVTMYDPFVNVKFRIPGNGPYIISIDSAYKAVTSENGFTLDVNTQVDYAIDSLGLSYDDDLRVIVDGSHLAGTTSLDTAAIEVTKGPNTSFIRALNVENFKRGYLLKSAEFRLSSLRLHNDNSSTLDGVAVELDSTTAEKIVIDTVNVDNFDIAFLLRDTIAGGNSISNSAIENVNTGFMLEDCDRMKITDNTIVKFNVAGIHWTLEDTTKVKTKDEDFAVIKDNYIGFLPYETVSASSGTGIILDGVKEETINANYIGNLIGDVDGIELIGNARKLIIKSNIIGEDASGNAQPIVGNGIRLMSDGDTLTENFISANVINNVSGAGVVLHGTRGNMVAANNIGDTSVTGSIGYGVIVKGWSTTKTAANERVYDNKIYNYTQHGIFCEYADSVTMNRNILMSKLAPATSKGINLNLTEGSASNNKKQAPAITDMNVLNASTMEIKGDGIAGEKIELFTTSDENTIQALEFAGHTVVDSDNHWKLLVYPPLVRFDKPVYVVATATEGGTGRTSELSLVKVKTKALCDLHSQDLLPDSARICPADKYIADLKLGKEMSYEWSLDGQVISYMTQSKSDLSKPGNYSILVKDLGVGDEQCSLTVNFKLNYLDAPYTPKILMATEVVAGDTIAAFDVADSTDFKLKNTDKWEWTKDSTVLIWDIESDPHKEHRKYNMVFPAPGTYKITLTTTNEGPCKEEDSKTITVYNQASLKQMQSDMPTEIMDVIAYPNPSDGDFAVKVTLNKWDDIYLDLYSSTGVLVYSTEAIFKKQHVFGISSNSLASGMYFVSIRSGSMRQIVKVVLSK